jgi:hypothetical protein
MLPSGPLAVVLWSHFVLEVPPEDNTSGHGEVERV